MKGALKLRPVYHAAMKAAQAGLAFGPSRALLSQLLPAPGQGPGDKTRRTGFFRIQIHTRTPAGARYLGTIAARGDPGYAATSVMLGETALRLALDRDHLPDRAGVLTPATAMGAALTTARLRSDQRATLWPPARSPSYRRRHPPPACPAFTRELRVHRGRLNALKKALDRTSHVGQAFRRSDRRARSAAVEDVGLDHFTSSDRRPSIQRTSFIPSCVAAKPSRS